MIDLAIEKFGLPGNPCITKELKLNGHDQPVPPPEISDLSNEELQAVIKKSVAEEMCMTVEDFLSRRTRQLLLDARAAIEIAPLVASLIAKEMNKNETWITEQINIFNDISKNYAPISNFKHQPLN